MTAASSCRDGANATSNHEGRSISQGTLHGTKEDDARRGEERKSRNLDEEEGRANIDESPGNKQ